MSTYKAHRVRLSVDCTEEQRMYIKMLAAKNHMTISEYLISLASKEMPKCTRRHEPNEQTKRAIRESQKDGEIYETVDEFWDAMGIRPDAEA